MPLDNANEYLPPIIRILLETDRLLAKPENWLRNELDNGEGGFCLLGAFVQARESLGLSEYGSGSLGYICEARHGSGWIAEYNNASSTTFADIKSVLAEAIELEAVKVAA